MGERRYEEYKGGEKSRFVFQVLQKIFAVRKNDYHCPVTQSENYCSKPASAGLP